MDYSKRAVTEESAVTDPGLQESLKTFIRGKCQGVEGERLELAVSDYFVFQEEA